MSLQDESSFSPENTKSLTGKLIYECQNMVRLYFNPMLFQANHLRQGKRSL